MRRRAGGQRFEAVTTFEETTRPLADSSATFISSLVIQW